MNLLLDTHAFVWLDIAKNRLSLPAQQAIQDLQNTVHVSLASVWELQIKIQLGKLLQLNNSLATTLISQQHTNAIRILPIRLNHILSLNNLPMHHHDPFDWMLIAQAQAENLTLVTNDSKMQFYPIARLW